MHKNKNSERQSALGVSLSGNIIFESQADVCWPARMGWIRNSLSWMDVLVSRICLHVLFTYLSAEMFWDDIKNWWAFAIIPRYWNARNISSSSFFILIYINYYQYTCILIRKIMAPALWGLGWDYNNNGSDTGLLPDGTKSITRTNADLVQNKIQ